MTIEIPEIPARWQELLASLQAIESNAILAGGAIRDLICGKPHRDLDFFIPIERQHLVFSGWLKEGYSWMSKALPEYELGNCLDNINWVLDVWEIRQRKDGILGFWKNTGEIVNLIVHVNNKTPLEIIEAFDFGICMVAYDGKNIIKSRHFDHDYENHVFSLRRDEIPGRREKSLKRFQKLSKKYTDWPLELSGHARLDQMVNNLKAKGRSSAPPSMEY